jgi:hypothetical protein
MAIETNVGLDTTFLAASDLSGNQFYFVSVNSSGNLVTAGSGVTGPRALGVLQDTPKGTTSATVRAQVRYGGISKVIAGGTFAIGDLISSNTTGQAVKYTAATNATGFGTASQVLGIAVLAGVTGDTSSIIFSPSGLSE